MKKLVLIVGLRNTFRMLILIAGLVLTTGAVFAQGGSAEKPKTPAKANPPAKTPPSSRGSANRDARAQKKPALGPDPSTMRDADIEKDSLHNLDVARQYFKLKKAYVASLKRCEEILAGNPNFAKIDETLFIAGMSDYYLSKSLGKQKPTLTPDKHRQEAREYLSQLANDHPDSDFSKQAQDALHDLGGALPKNSGQ